MRGVCLLDPPGLLLPLPLPLTTDTELAAPMLMLYACRLPPAVPDDLMNGSETDSERASPPALCFLGSLVYVVSAVTGRLPLHRVSIRGVLKLEGPATGPKVVSIASMRECNAAQLSRAM